MSIVVTGATGPLGRLIVESMLRRGVPPGRSWRSGGTPAESPTWPNAGWS